MNKTLVLLSCFIFVSGLVGCQSANSGVEVVIEGGGEFPEFLVGQWKADKSRWTFTFDPDGRISKMRHSWGIEFNVPEGGLVEQWRGNIEAIYVLETCEAGYNRQTRELSVTIVIDPFIINLVDGSMEAKLHDSLTGRVSEDGTTWNATWTSTGEIIGGGSIDPNKVEPKPLTFTKVD